MKLESLVDQLQKIYGANLLSIILYGSAAGGDFQQKYSDYNLMVLLKDVSTTELGRAAKLTRKWMRGGNPPPLFADPEYLATSCDVFPIEFFDMKEQHKILFGENPFSGMNIATEHLRLECESELKAKILALREQFLQIYPSKRKIRKRMLSSVSALFAVLRGMLRLKNVPIPATKRETLQRLSEIAQFDTAIFEKILDVREGQRELPRNEVLPWFDDYLTTLKKIARVADKL